jgi:lysozyme
MLAACQKGEWDKAANEMLDSKWASQVKQRAKTLAEIMRKGN